MVEADNVKMADPKSKQKEEEISPEKLNELGF